MFIGLEQMGVLDSLFPFLLIFTVIFAFLQKTPFMAANATKSKNFDLMIAFILAAITVIPHVIGKYPQGRDPIAIINQAIPNVSVLLILIISIWIIAGMFGGGVGVKHSYIGPVLAIASLIGVLVIFAQAAGIWGVNGFPPWLDFLNDSETRGVLLVVGAFVAVVVWITRDTSTPGTGLPWKDIWTGMFRNE